MSPVNEHQILEALRQAPTERWGEILVFVRNLQVVNDGRPTPTQWTAADLLKLPAAERDEILTRQAARAESHYVSDSELTAFDAYGEDDLYVDSSDTQTK